MGGEYRRGRPDRGGRPASAGRERTSAGIRRPPALYGEHMTERRGDQGFSVTPQRLGGGRGGGPGSPPDPRLGLADRRPGCGGDLRDRRLGPRLNGPAELRHLVLRDADPVPTPSPTDRPRRRRPVRSRRFATPLPSITRPAGIVRSARSRSRPTASTSSTSRPARSPAGRRPSRPRRALPLADRGRLDLHLLHRRSRTTASEPATRSSTTMPSGAPGDQRRARRLLTMPQDGRRADAHDRRRLVRRRPSTACWRVATSAGRAGTCPVSPASTSTGPSLGKPVVDPAEASTPAPIPSPTATPRPGRRPAAARIGDRFVDGPHVRVARVARWRSSGAHLATIRPRRADAGGHRRLADGARIRTDDRRDRRHRVRRRCRLLLFGGRLRPRRPPGLGLPAGRSAVRAERIRAVGARDDRPDGTCRGPAGPAAPGRLFDEPLFDRANGHLYLWDPTGLTMSRIDVHSFAVASGHLRSGRPPAARDRGGGPERPRLERRRLRDPAERVRRSSPDPRMGRGCTRIGFDSAGSRRATRRPSRGIFVIDRSTLALLDRWAPAAYYLSVSATSRRPVVAPRACRTSMSDGKDAPWQGSLTVYDPAGRPDPRPVRPARRRRLPPLVVDR